MSKTGLLIKFRVLFFLLFFPVFNADSIHMFYVTLLILRAISVILGDTWKAMKQEERKQYVIQAKILADEHKRINPDCWKRKRNSEVGV